MVLLNTVDGDVVGLLGWCPKKRRAKYNGQICCVHSVSLAVFSYSADNKIKVY